VLHPLALRIHQPQPRLGLHLANARHGCLALRGSCGHGGAVRWRGGGAVNTSS